MSFRVRTTDRSQVWMAAALEGARAGVAQWALRVETDAKLYAPVLTGNLRRSIHTEVKRVGAVISATVGSEVDYAPYQEFGTSRMAAHPYLRPALDKNKGEGPGLISAAIARATR